MKQKQRLSAPADLSVFRRSEKSGALLPGAGLKAEDAALWQRVAETVKPLAQTRRGRKKSAISAERLKAEAAAIAAPAPAAAAEAARLDLQAPLQEGFSQAAAAAPAIVKPAAGLKKPCLSNFDSAAYKRLARGALPIEARLDLHGFTQNEAHDALLCFIRLHQARGRRYVLIITGRGRSLGSEGVLQRQVPHWLAQAPFRLYVAAIEAAARPHGGSGAFYVRLRRNV